MARNDCVRKLAVCLVIAVGTIALYFPALHFGFVNVDDVYVTANPNVNHGLTAHGLAWAFQAGYAGNWHPATWISHMVDAQFFGPKGKAGITRPICCCTPSTRCFCFSC